MDPQAAARLGDEIAHGYGIASLLAGAVAGALIGAAVIGATALTGGLAVAAMIGAIALGGCSLHQVLKGISTIFDLPEPASGVLVRGSPDVFINNRNAMRAGDDVAAFCTGFPLSHPEWPFPLKIAEGSATVFINNRPAARVGSKMTCGAHIKSGSPDVFIGGPTLRVCFVLDLESWLKTGLEVVGLGAVAAGAIFAAMAGAAALGIFAGVTGGVTMGMKTIKDLGDRLGPGYGDLVQGVAGMFLLGVGPKIAKFPMSLSKATPEAALLKGTDLEAVTGEPVDGITGEVLLEQTDFTLPGRIPLPWTRRYGSRTARTGVCGHGWQTPADARLERSASGKIIFHDGSPRGALFDELPGDIPIREAIGGAVLSRSDDGLMVRLKSGLHYHFHAPEGNPEELLVERITDGSGNWVCFVRGDHGLSRIDTSCGQTVRVDSRDGLISAIYLEGADREDITLARYTYCQEGNLASVIDPLGVPSRFSYDGRLMSGHTDRNGLTFHYAYDTSGRCIRTRGDGGLYEYRFTYLDEDKITLATDAHGNVTRLHYDETNQLLAKTDPLGNTTRYEYNDRYFTTAVIDPLGRRTEYDYDESGDVTSVTRPDGAQMIIEYDHTHHPVSITDPQSSIWKQEWNGEGLLISRTSPTGARTCYRYDNRGGLIAVTGPMGATTRYELDGCGNLTALIDHLGNRTACTRDILGNILSVTDPAGAQTCYGYDAASRLIHVKRPGGAEASFAYDNEGNLIRHRDELGHETRLEYTGIGKVARRGNPDGTTLTYRYDNEERLVSLTNERGETCRFKRDRAGRTIEQSDYWGGVTRYRYDPVGMLISKTDPLGQVTSYRYDPLGRLTGRLFSDGSREMFAYDRNGNLVLHVNPDATVQRIFDAEGRLTREIQGDFTVENHYDLAGRRIKRTSSHGNTNEFGYDPLGNVTDITINGRNVSHIERNSLGLPIKETLPNDISRNYSYDMEGRLTGEALFGAPSNWVRSYGYDKAGNLTRRKDPRFGESHFTYDPLGRVAQSIDPEGKISEFLYDPAGYLLRKEDAEPGARSLEYQGSGYRFDTAGNLVRREGRKSSTWHTWDSAGRLTEALNTNGTRTTLRYDALGRRISKETDGRKTDFYWDGDRLLSDTRHREAPREFVYYPGTFVPFAAIEGNGNIRYYHNDIAGIPQEVRDDEGNVLWQARYDALGRVARLKGSYLFDNPIRLQGQYYDEELDLCYNRYRYFDPQICSFISKDPLGLAAGENLYSYAPNVWGWADPLGLCVAGRGNVDFYATIDGQTFPSQFHRYLYAKYAPMQDAKTGILPAKRGGTYVSFDKIDDSIVASGKLQIPYRPDYRVSGDTLNVLDQMQIPSGKWGTADYPEPLTKDYKIFGPGKATQVNIKGPVPVDPTTIKKLP